MPLRHYSSILPVFTPKVLRYGDASEQCGCIFLCLLSDRYCFTDERASCISVSFSSPSYASASILLPFCMKCTALFLLSFKHMNHLDFITTSFYPSAAFCSIIAFIIHSSCLLSIMCQQDILVPDGLLVSCLHFSL